MLQKHKDGLIIKKTIDWEFGSGCIGYVYSGYILVSFFWIYANLKTNTIDSMLFLLSAIASTVQASWATPHFFTCCFENEK